MSITGAPYLAFRGQAREAMNFYQQIFGGELQLLDWQGPDAKPLPSGELPVMHGHLKTAAGWEFMGADSIQDDTPDSGVQRMNICVFGDEVDAMTTQFNALAEGGHVSMPLERQMWGDMFGNVTDKFGINWGFNVELPKN